MIISRSMNAEKLRDLMGGAYTEADARRFRELLCEAGFVGVDTSRVPDDNWHSILDLLDDQQ